MHKALANLSKQLELVKVGTTYDQECYFLVDKSNPEGRRLYVLEGKDSRLELLNIYDGSTTIITNYCTFHRNITDSGHTRGMTLDSIFMCFVCGLSDDKGQTIFHYYPDNLKPVGSLFTLGDFELHITGITVEISIPNVPTPYIGKFRSIPQGNGKSPDILWEAKIPDPIRGEMFFD